MKRTICTILALLLLCAAGCAEVATTANVSVRTADNGLDAAAIPEITAPPTSPPTQTLSAVEGGDTGASTPSGTGGEEIAATPTPLATPSPTPELTPSPAPDYTVKPVDGKKAYLNAGSANLREGPGTEYAILEELFELETLVVTGTCGDWYRVEAGNETGFILAEFVEYGTAPTPTPSFRVKSMDDKDAYVNAGSANLREGPGMEFDIIVELGRNEELTVTGASGDWYRVEYGRKTGFMMQEFVEFGSVPTSKPKATATTPKPSATPKPSMTAEPSPTPAASAGTAGGSSSSGADPYDYFSDTSRFTAAELLLIAQVVQEEAKGSSVEARAAVANAIYNRYRSSSYPNTIEGVIFQKNQYTVADDEDELRAVKPIDKTIEAVTQIFVNGNTFLPEDVLFFRTASRGTSWGDKREYYATYGGNAFFRSLY